MFSRQSHALSFNLEIYCTQRIVRAQNYWKLHNLQVKIKHSYSVSMTNIRISAFPKIAYSQVWGKFNICGLDHSGSEPFNYNVHVVAPLNSHLSIKATITLSASRS